MSDQIFALTTKKLSILLLTTALLSAVIFGREWLIDQEIQSTQDQLRFQIASQIDNAATLERLTYLSSSDAVYERYLEPIILIANKYLWPTSRREAVGQWKRDVHAKIEDFSHSRMTQLQAAAEEKIRDLRAKSNPDISRLLNIVQVTKDLNSEMAAKAISEEIKLISEASRQKDQELVKTLASEGQKGLKTLRSSTKGMSQQKFSQYLSSGRFFKEIQQPVVELILKIKQEDLRQNVWNEYRHKLVEVLSNKNQGYVKKRKVDQFDSLFEPLAEMSVKSDQIKEKIVTKELNKMGEGFEVKDPIEANPADSRAIFPGDLYE